MTPHRKEPGRTPASDDERDAEVQVSVRSIATGGEGVAELPDGRVCFVHRTAPGDRARIRVTTEKPSWARGELVELLEHGPGRRDPPCPFYERCGGCTLEHLHYEEQLRWKGRIVRDVLERIGGVEVPIPDVTASPRTLRYRSRITLHLRRLGGGDRVVAGFHELARPGRILDVDGRCLLPVEALADAWEALRRSWGPGARRLPPGRALRITLRAAEEGVIAVVEPGKRSRSPTEGERGEPETLLREVDGLAALWYVPRRGPAELLAGDTDVDVEWMGRRVRPGPGAFLQVNRDAAAELHRAVLECAGAPAERVVVDAYCGAGWYGRALARGGDVVTGIETNPDAVRAARAGAPAGFKVLDGTVEERLDEALPADLVLVNPPRAGLDEAVCARLEASGVERLVYVSCNPATLARDVERLGESHRLTAVRAFDLFPQTAHVETLALLTTSGTGETRRASATE